MNSYRGRQFIQPQKTHQQIEQERFGELRSILQRRPNKKSWERLLSLLEGLPTEQLQEQDLPYCVSQFKRNTDWHYLKREAPTPWVKQLLERGCFDPRFALVNHLDMSPYRAAPDVIVSLLTADPHAPLGQLRVLSLHRCALDDKHVTELLNGLKMSALEALHLGQNRITMDSVTRLFKATTALPQLELLDLSGTIQLPSAALVDELIAHQLPKLSWVNLQGCRINAKDLQRLLHAEQLPLALRQSALYI